MMQRVYGFGTCFGIALVFGFLVGLVILLTFLQICYLLTLLV